MPNTDQQPSRLTLREALPALGAGLSVFLLVGWFNGRRQVFSADHDEGFALIQGLLVSRGHALYSETWSDQPPGYTWLIAALTYVLGPAPEVARLLTSALLAAFATACFALCTKIHRGIPGWLGGITCSAALLLESEIFRFGVAAMISLPALLLAGLAWAATQTTASRRSALLSGALLGLALAVKPLAAPAAPAIFIGLTWASLQQRQGLNKTLRSLAIAGGACALALALFYWPVLLRAGGETVYRTHELRAPLGWIGLERLLSFVREDSWLFWGAGLSLPLLLLRRRGEAAALGTWLVLGSIALARYQPVWSHHRYLVLLPTAPLLGLGVSEGIALALSATSKWKRLAAAAFCVTLLGVVVSHFPQNRVAAIEKNFNTDNRKANAVMTLLQGLGGAQRMVTSRQMYAYRLGLDIPPSQAATSSKRFWRWKLSSSELVRTSLAFDPDIVILEKHWPVGTVRAIRKALSTSHLLVSERGTEIVLVRASLAPDSLKGLPQR